METWHVFEYSCSWNLTKSHPPPWKNRHVTNMTQRPKGMTRHPQYPLLSCDTTWCPCHTCWPPVAAHDVTQRDSVSLDLHLRHSVSCSVIWHPCGFPLSPPWHPSVAWLGVPAVSSLTYDITWHMSLRHLVSPSTIAQAMSSSSTQVDHITQRLTRSTSNMPMITT